MDLTRIVRRIGGMAVSISALALLAGGATQAQAADCERSLLGGGPASGWEVDSSDAEFNEALLLTRVGSDSVRDDAFDGYGVVTVNGSDYDNPDDGACVFQNRYETVYPADELAGLFVRPQLFVHPKRPLGRQFVSLYNPTNAPITVDIGWDGDLGSDDGTRVARTSSGDNVMDSADRWATTCEDYDADGCANVADESNRDPELAHNWEGRGQHKRESADLVSNPELDAPVDFSFEDVTVGAGKRKTFMQLVSLAPTIKAANRMARRIDRRPGRHGAFAGLTRMERRKLQNW